MNKRIRAGAFAAALAFMLGGCAAGDKAGNETVVLNFATVNGDLRGAGSQPFIDGLTAASGGRLKVEVATDFGKGAPDNEVQLIRAVQKGTVDGAWVGVRSFAAAGVPGLDSLMAPFELTSIAAENQIVEGGGAELALGALNARGLHGLALLTGELRHPFAHGEPLLQVADWQNAAFRYYASPTQKAAIEALGGKARWVGFEWIEQTRQGTLRGADFGISSYLGNGYGTQAEQATANIVLWPSMLALVVGQKRWNSLTAQQRGWVEDAAARARTAASTADYSDDAAMAPLCARGVVFSQATPEQLDGLKAATAPVIDGLLGDPDESALITEVLAAAKAHPRPDTPVIPAQCHGPSTATPDTAAPIPDGTYRVDIRLGDVEAAGLTNAEGSTGIWTLIIHNGEYALSCRPADLPGKDCGNTDFNGGVAVDTPLEAGYLRGDESRVWIIYDADVHDHLAHCGAHCAPVETTSFDWTFDGTTLRFIDRTGTSFIQWPVKGWTKIA